LRIPNALAFVGTALLVLGLMRRIDPGRALLGACVWTTSIGPIAAANVVTADTLLTLFETLAVYGFVSSGALTRERDAVQRWRLDLMWVGFGLAFLTKGPPGLLPLLAILAWGLVQPDRRRLLPLLLRPVGLLLFAVIGFSWYLAVALREPGLLRYFIDVEVINRVAAHGARNPGWFGWVEPYVPTALVGLFPWVLVLLARIRAPAEPRADVPLAARRFLRWWLLLPLAIFLLSQSRLPLYLLPLMVPGAILLALYIPSAFVRGTRAAVVLAVAVVFAITLKGVSAHVPSKRDALRFALEIERAVDLEAFDEITFVDVTPAYGLHIYLNREVEEAESHRLPGDVEEFGGPESMCVELAEPERNLFFVKTQWAARATSRAASCGFDLRELGRVREFSLMAGRRLKGP
jgi:4-amino-4-deoxy-L-arabinose transferase